MKNLVRNALYGLCALALLSAPSAFADQKPQNSRTAAPWYERFTFGTDSDSSLNAWSPRADSKANVKFSPKSKWGLSFGVQDQNLKSIDVTRGQAASAGAFYDVNKNIRVGTQLVLPQDQRDYKNEKKSGPGIKVESAFRF